MAVTGTGPVPVRRTGLQLSGDPRRVVSRLFLPGQEGAAPGDSRAAGVVRRCLAMSEQEAGDLLAEVLADHQDRHRDLPGVLEAHFAAVAHAVPDAGGLSAQRRQLIGAYFTQEFSVEAAALFNPSIVPHPRQDLGPGKLRFVLSARAVGEGHLSSVVFRTGVIDSDPAADEPITLDPRSVFADAGRHRASTMDHARVGHEALLAGVEPESLAIVLAQLPDPFTSGALERALERLSDDALTRNHAVDTAQYLRAVSDGWYQVEFPPATRLSERTLLPQIAVESRGVEDARFVRFRADDGSSSYLATYTAFDGGRITVRQYRTDDFVTFCSEALTGRAATNKGLALFPRTVNGQHLALSRWDRENTAIAFSADGYHWPESRVLQAPEQPWELIQLGNCGSPIETEQGWLVLTHGVGAMRGYSIGALLLDLDDPSTVIGRLSEPLLRPAADERDGYVPNVVYSCGSLVHDGQLVLPYGCSDSRIRVARVDLPELLDRLLHTA